MHSRFRELSDYLDAQRLALLAAIDDVPPAQRSVVPPQGGWTANGVIEHLTLVENRIISVLRTKLAEARAAGLGPETDDSPVLPSLGLDPLLNRTVRLAASPAAQPTGQMDTAQAWAALQAARGDLGALMRDADGLAVSQIVHPHPALGPRDFYGWIGFVGAHEARHAAQLREIAASLPRD